MVIAYTDLLTRHRLRHLSSGEKENSAMLVFLDSIASQHSYGTCQLTAAISG